MSSAGRGYTAGRVLTMQSAPGLTYVARRRGTVRSRAPAPTVIEHVQDDAAFLRDVLPVCAAGGRPVSVPAWPCSIARMTFLGIADATSSGGRTKFAVAAALEVSSQEGCSIRCCPPCLSVLDRLLRIGQGHRQGRPVAELRNWGGGRPSPAVVDGILRLKGRVSLGLRME